MVKRKTQILILDKDNPKKELEFEIEFMRTLTLKQRCKIMERVCREGLRQRKWRHGKKMQILIARPLNASHPKLW